MATESTSLVARLLMTVDPASAKALKDFWKSNSADAAGFAEASRKALSGTGLGGGAKSSSSSPVAASEKEEIALERQRLALQADRLKLEKAYGITIDDEIPTSKAEIQLERDRLALLRDQLKLQQQQGEAADARLAVQAQDKNASLIPTEGLQRPTRLAFTLSSFGGLASTLGLPGIAGALAGGSDVAGALEGITQLQRQLPVLAQRLQGLGGVVGGLATLGGEATTALGGGGLASSLGSILAVAVPAVAIIGGLAFIVGKIGQEFSDAKQEAQDYLTAQADVNTLVAGGATTEDLTKTRDDAVAQQKGYQDTVNRGKELLQNYRDANQALSETLNTVGAGATPEAQDAAGKKAQAAEQALKDFFGVIPDNIGGLPAITSSLDDMQKKADGAQVAIVAANLALQSQGVQENNSRKAAEDTAKKNADILSAQIQGTTAGNDAVKRLTTKGLQERIQAISDEEVTQSSFRNRMTTEQKAAMDVRIAGLEAEADVIRGRLLPALSNLQAFIKQNADAFQKFGDNAAALKEKFTEDQKQTMVERLTSAARESVDFGISRGRALRDSLIQQRRADEDTGLEQQKQNLDTQRRAQDLFARIRKIMLDALEKMGDAVADRDALAFVKAQRDRDKQLAEINQQTAIDEQRRQEDQALADRAKAIARQRQTEDFQRRLQDEDADRALRLNRLQQDNDRQDYLKQQAYFKQEQQLLKALNDQTGILDIMGQNFTTFLNNARAAIAASSQAVPANLLVGNPVFNNGTPVHYGSDRTLNLNIQGATQQSVIATSAAEAGRVFGSILHLMGAR